MQHGNTTAKMPAFQLDDLLARLRGEEDVVFPLVRRRPPRAGAIDDVVIPKSPVFSGAVALALFGGLVAALVLAMVWLSR